VKLKLSGLTIILILESVFLAGFLLVVLTFNIQFPPTEHALLELYSSAAGLYIFAVGLGRYIVLKQRIALFLGTSFLATSLVDIIHAFAHPGILKGFGNLSYGITTGLAAAFTLGILLFISSGSEAGTPWFNNVTLALAAAVTVSLALAITLGFAPFFLPIKATIDHHPTKITIFLTSIAVAVLLIASARFAQNYYKLKSPLYSWTASGLIIYAFHLVYVASSDIFSSAFNIGHFLKILSYGVILYGAVFEYIQLYRTQQKNYEDEARRAASVQTKILPGQHFEIPQLEIRAKQIQARIVGGDWYDFFTTNNKIIVSIGDASGKGMFAAILATLAITNIRSIYVTERPIYQMLKTINREMLLRISEEYFATLFLCEINPIKKSITYVSCGHDPPFVYKADPGYWMLLSQETTLPLGVDLYQFKPIEKELILNRGDRLLLYTDGLHDVRNELGQFYPIEKIQTFLQENKEQSLEELVEGVIRNALAFSEKEIFDDITVVGLEIK
jgi:serine phosphatase RsbU (regulator of sigma subunit)